MRIDQRLGAAAEVNLPHGADDDPMAVALDDFLDSAVDDGKRVLKPRGARGELAPLGAFVAGAAPDPAAARELIRDVLMACVENVDAKVPLTLDDRPRRLTQTSMVGGSSERDIAEVTVSPVLPSPEPAVITLTPPTRCRIAALNVAGSAPWAETCRSAIVIA
jgi:hypothetical protein